MSRRLGADDRFRNPKRSSTRAGRCSSVHERFDAAQMTSAEIASTPPDDGSGFLLLEDGSGGGIKTARMCEH